MNRPNGLPWCSALLPLTGVTLVVALAGCASPSGIEPAARRIDAVSLGAQATATVEWPEDAWWARFGDTQLDALVARAIADSPTLAQARARLVGAQAAAEGADAERRPQVTGSIDITDQRFSENGLFGPPLAGSVRWTNSTAVNFGWEIDFWGRNRAAFEAASNQARAAEAGAQAARLLLTAAVSRTYFQLARLTALRRILVDTRAQREQVLVLVSDRVKAGLDNSLPLRQAEGAVAQIQVEIDSTDEAIALTRHALAALLGAGPDAAASLAPALEVAQPFPLPAAIPADLVGRRADITAARWRVEAAARDTEVAKADFYPNVNLIASVGLNSLGFPNWLQAGSIVYGVGPAVRLPIFDAGRLRANLRGKTADLDLAIENYNAAVVDAVRDVADQIASLRSVAAQRSQQAKAETAAESAYELALQRYRAGLETYLTVLVVQDTLLRERRVTADLKARALELNVNLMRALGGGFRPDALATSSGGFDAAATPGSGTRGSAVAEHVPGAASGSR